MFGIDDAAAAAIGGDLLSGGMDIIGGQLSASQNRQAQRSAKDISEDFAKHGIQWRVDDAKAAGIHPLYALNAILPQSNPIALGDQTAQSFHDAGQNLARAAGMGISQDQRNRTELENQLLLAQIDESDARKEAIRSETARNKQAQISSIGPQPESFGPWKIDGQSPLTPGGGVVDIEPSKITSASAARPSMEAGIRPGEEQRSIGGMPILLPQLGGESAEEIISEMSLPAWIGLLARNSTIYGKDWLNDFLKMRYLGKEPDQYHPSIQEQRMLGHMHEPKNQVQNAVEALGGGMAAATERAIGTYRSYKRRYKRWSDKNPSGRR